MIKKNLLFLFLLGNFCSLSQEIDFYKENVTMEISEGYFHVTGVYYLRSDTTLPFPLTYPFPNDSLYGEVDSIVLFDLNTGDTIEMKKRTESGILFVVEPDASGRSEILISYCQGIYGNKAEYILETTRKWQKPIKEATFQLITPPDMDFVSFSYAPGDTIITSQNKIYTWQKTRFMPEENMIFEW